MPSTEAAQPAETPQKKADSRKNLRAPLMVLKVAEEVGGRNRLFGYAKNISCSGLFIQSVNPREPGDCFTISFEVPEANISVTCRCEVVWKRHLKRKVALEPGYGIRFLDVNEIQATAIDAWVRKNQ
ncbi:MAG TPA: PilZ domain-containing protein [Nitrospiria bacterium]|nr:PilZ domain-containing protein [Nitrospiria bacterium]